MAKSILEVEANKAIKWHYYDSLSYHGYLYLDAISINYKEEIDKLRKMNSSDNSLSEKIEYLAKIEEYFCSKKWYSNAFRKKRKHIFETLKSTDKKYSVCSNLLYDSEKIKLEKATNVSSYLTILKKISAKNETFYRGQSNFKWGIRPSIYREERLIENEKLMIDMMIQNNPDEFNFNTTFDVLSKLQHYGLPTRLVDITSNPLVALYFATINDTSEDGQIFVFVPEKDKIKFVDSDTVAALANIAKMEIDFGNNDVMNHNTERLIHLIRKEKPFFEDKLKDEYLNDYVFVKASYNNKRIAKQNGAFILIGIQKGKGTPTEIQESINIGGKLTKIIIPYPHKKGITSELNTLSINEGTMFPEIDSMAKYIRSKIGK